jgi:hypothetical protein
MLIVPISAVSKLRPLRPYYLEARTPRLDLVSKLVT